MKFVRCRMTSQGTSFIQVIDDKGNLLRHIDENGNILAMPEVYEAKVVEDNSTPNYLKPIQDIKP